MKSILQILSLLFFVHISYGQTKNICNCPKGQDLAHQGAPEKIFRFKNGKQIGLCADMKIENKDTIYYEAILYHCGDDGFFRSWDGIDSCKITQQGDTIVVQELFRLPVASDMSLVKTTFRIEKMFYKGASFIDSTVYRTDIPKYTSSQIQNVLDQYAGLKQGDYDKILEIELRLFWAYISGSKEADKYLMKFENQFGPFPEKKEEFENARALYWFYKLDNMSAKNRAKLLP